MEIKIGEIYYFNGKPANPSGWSIDPNMMKGFWKVNIELDRGNFKLEKMISNSKSYNFWEVWPKFMGTAGFIKCNKIVNILYGENFKNEI